MQTKLTLRLDNKLIRDVKAYARKNHRSLSMMVADYFYLLGNMQRSSERNAALPPITRSLKGILKSSNGGLSDYKKHLEEKYL